MQNIVISLESGVHRLLDSLVESKDEEHLSCVLYDVLQYASYVSFILLYFPKQTSVLFDLTFLEKLR